MVILLVLQSIIALALIGVILLQKSEGGGLGLGGGGSSGNVFTARGAANFLTRLTAVLAAVFMLNCLLMTIVSGRQIHQDNSILAKDEPLVESTQNQSSSEKNTQTPNNTENERDTAESKTSAS